MRKVKAWRVLACDKKRLVWTVRSTHDSEQDAWEYAEYLWYQGLKATVQPYLKSVLTIKPPPPYNVTQSHRELQAAIMSDLADEKKRYKSPG